MAENILQEADRIVDGDRQADYGPVRHDFARIAGFWSVILGVPVMPRDVPLCMIALKMSREICKHKRDNLVDMAGYARTLEKYFDEIDDLEASDAAFYATQKLSEKTEATI